MARMVRRKETIVLSSAEAFLPSDLYAVAEKNAKTAQTAK